MLLGEKLPRPPKDVPRLPEDEATETLTVRELTEKHSTDPKCYGCHRRIDPYGYSLEAFGFQALQVLQGGLLRDLEMRGDLAERGLPSSLEEGENDLAPGIHGSHRTSFSTSTLK